MKIFGTLTCHCFAVRMTALLFSVEKPVFSEKTGF